ncbi:MAG: response regulator [Novosphingobium sp.]
MNLTAKRILVIEDEFLVAAMLCDFLEDAGAVTIGPVGRVDEGLVAIAEGGFDLAVLDWNLCGESSEPLAEALAASGVPFVIATGYGAVGGGFDDRPILAKPYAWSDAVSLIGSLV